MRVEWTEPQISLLKDNNVGGTLHSEMNVLSVNE